MIAVGVVDVGSPKASKLGWAILAPDQEACQGRGLDDFIEHMVGLSAQCLRGEPQGRGPRETRASGS
jgi:hypothetical protein